MREDEQFDPHSSTWAFITPHWLNRSQPKRKKEKPMSLPIYPCGCAAKFDHTTGGDKPFCRAEQGHCVIKNCHLNWAPLERTSAKLPGVVRGDGTSVLDYKMPPPNTGCPPVVSPYSNGSGFADTVCDIGLP